MHCRICVNNSLMDADLAQKLSQRIRRIESAESSSETSSINGNSYGTGTNDESDSPLSSSSASCEYHRPVVFNPYTEYSEFSRKQIQSLMQTFNKYDLDKDKLLSFNELKFMMEKLGIPQTHLGLKEMIKQVDEDNDGKISFREFLLIFRKAISENSEIENEKTSITSVLQQLYAMLVEIDVSKEGVGGAKNFFEAKVAAIKEQDKFQREIREEQEQRRRVEEDKARRKIAFQNRLAQFQQT
ncbi:unnamed protein product [Rotaria sordida]|uniref:EF-hand domain-containing protein n=6 Tax=Rotaria sordida TaxID=392033 RepID=A0A814LI70_9BILA|nr:unnamed protein product [Rotaria sordida]CAF1045061.1 unnamed protein product [Rotaria sordida]CAF1045539.1 unnamed protein product [Rotaria sordida]CAF1066204.1 unnamed protein product [Rotaria sordida]